MLTGAVALGVATSIIFAVRRRRSRNRNGVNNEDGYQAWLRKTRELLAKATTDADQIDDSVHIYLGPSIRIGRGKRAWAQRAVEEGQLSWTHGQAFIGLPPDESPGS